MIEKRMQKHHDCGQGFEQFTLWHKETMPLYDLKFV